MVQVFFLVSTSLLGWPSMRPAVLRVWGRISIRAWHYKEPWPFQWGGGFNAFFERPVSVPDEEYFCNSIAKATLKVKPHIFDGRIRQYDFSQSHLCTCVPVSFLLSEFFSPSLSQIVASIHLPLKQLPRTFPHIPGLEWQQHNVFGPKIHNLDSMLVPHTDGLNTHR